MERPLESFTKEDRAKFIHDLSSQAGVLPEDMTNKTFRRGCTIFEAQFDREAVRYLVDAFDNALKSEKVIDLTGFTEFMRKYNISVIIGTTARHGESFQETGYRDKPVIIFVHGWDGGYDAFGNFPKFLNEKTGLDCLTYEYPTGIWAHSPDIMLIARNLDNWIRNKISKRPIIFLAHSMGGLVVRKLVTIQHWRTERLDENTKYITFVASPHVGTTWASLAMHVPTLKKDQLRDLSPNSSTLVELNEQWLVWCTRNVPGACGIKSIYGTCDQIVPIASALFNDSEGIPIFCKGHINIVKPESIEDEIVVTKHRLLKEAGICK